MGVPYCIVKGKARLALFIAVLDLSEGHATCGAIFSPIDIRCSVFTKI